MDVNNVIPRNVTWMLRLPSHLTSSSHRLLTMSSSQSRMLMYVHSLSGDDHVLFRYSLGSTTTTVYNNVVYHTLCGSPLERHGKHTFVHSVHVYWLQHVSVTGSGKRMWGNCGTDDSKRRFPDNPWCRNRKKMKLISFISPHFFHFAEGWPNTFLIIIPFLVQRKTFFYESHDDSSKDPMEVDCWVTFALHGDSE